MIKLTKVNDVKFKETETGWVVTFCRDGQEFDIEFEKEKPSGKFFLTYDFFKDDYLMSVISKSIDVVKWDYTEKGVLVAGRSNLFEGYNGIYSIVLDNVDGELVVKCAEKRA